MIYLSTPLSLKWPKLTDHRLLSFDVYGNWESGVLTNLNPLLNHLRSANQPTREQTLDIYHSRARKGATVPDAPYTILPAPRRKPMRSSPPRVGFEDEPATEEGMWGFCWAVGGEMACVSGPDTVDALRRLGWHYKTESGLTGSLRRRKSGRVRLTAGILGTCLRRFRKELGVEKGEVLRTAQSRFHDHHPAWEMGITSVWIERYGAMGNRVEKVYDWRFFTLGDMADAVEKEVGGG